MSFRSSAPSSLGADSEDAMENLMMMSSSSSISAASAFSKSPCPTQRESECPLSSKCSLEWGERLSTHLEQVHKAKRFAVPCDAEGYGKAEMNAPVVVGGRGEHSSRRSAVLLDFCGMAFVWVFEVRWRADAELQVSVSVQQLPQEATSTTTATADQSVTSPTADDFAEREHCIWISAPFSAAEKPSFSVPEWKGTVTAGTRHHDRLVSRGEALILLYSANKDSFRGTLESGDVSLQVLTNLKRSM